ncbi:hypothetical protein [Streptomyces arenae]|uniref:hypothetical protein n=1 Tax=Streptomyces arenae TaxID=29301 RepID=UPI002658D8FE|nr:hypothetical protein [Streptomyces arenae]MCG7207389.1 hypothetical protein [Streptomyces arenae]
MTLTYDACSLEAGLEEISIAGRQQLVRDESEVWVLLPTKGSIVEGNWTVHPGDVLVLEGDDPCVLEVEPLAPSGGFVLMAHLRRRDGRALRWMP